MMIKILTSGFPNVFTDDFSSLSKTYLKTVNLLREYGNYKMSRTRAC